ncbi:MAG: tetratricopeptide repeat protein, partial [Deltaproteobacteria bacterium]|nr:tetratricopeptide repeat protein [Deltaproteobacteria bacterium]
MALSDETYNKIMDTIARPQSNLSLIELLKDQGDTGSLIKACLKSLETFPDDIAVREILAEIYFEQGYAGLAEGEIDSICRKIDELSKIYKIKAKLYKKEGRFDEAIKSLQLYSAHCPDDQEANGLLAELVAAAGEEKSVLITPTMAE